VIFVEGIYAGFHGAKIVDEMLVDGLLVESKYVIALVSSLSVF
jgi:hypothetical protein